MAAYVLRLLNMWWQKDETDRDWRALRKTVVSQRYTTVTKVTVELDMRLENGVSTKIVRRELHEQNIHGRAAIAQSLVTQDNAKRRLH